MLKHRRTFSLWISFRYLTSKATSSFISFISYISIAGLTLGIAVLIIVLSVMNGFASEIKNRILGVVHHADILQKPEMPKWQEHINIVKKDNQIEALAPYIKIEGMLSSQNSVQPVLVYGVEPKYEQEVSIIEDFMEEQTSIHQLQDKKFRIVIGDFIARSLKVDVGDKISLIIPQARVSITGVSPKFRVFTVVGVFKLGSELDSSLAMIHIKDAARLKGYQKDSVEGIRLLLKDVFDAPFIVNRLANKLSKQTKEQFYFTNWTYKYGNLFKSILMEKRLVGLLLFLIIAVAAFNIISSMVMVVSEKKSDIAVLRTMGASSRNILTIFLMQGFYIGLIGCVLGSILGLLVAYNITEITSFIEKIFNIQFLNTDTYFIDYFPSEIWVEDIVSINLIAFSLCILSTIYPALKASKIDPALVLRNE